MEKFGGMTGRKIKKERLDVLLVMKGLCESRQKARALVLAGDVLVNGGAVFKSGSLIPEDSEIKIKEKFQYVGRGALKLFRALDYYKIDPTGMIALDVGSSTGGFTQALLERGACLVYAVDCGTNQLDWRLRNDPRVRVMENTNARMLTREMFEPRPEIAVIDVSFISITKILKPVMDVLWGDYRIIVLIKPQFELERGKIGKRGLAAAGCRQEAVKRVLSYAGSIGLIQGDVIESPIVGLKSGNVEYFAMMSGKLLLI
jgi:23S rRNA (cytidine1920-2'-O)/16S rRNA (cytidine1409-2'-O)-methyltransferase